MKKLIISICILTVIAMLFSSCSANKKGNEVVTDGKKDDSYSTDDYVGRYLKIEKLYYYDSLEPFFGKVGLLLAMTAVVFAVSALFVRRQRYASL